jgi:hypothetical protein
MDNEQWPYIRRQHHSRGLFHSLRHHLRSLRQRHRCLRRLYLINPHLMLCERHST